MTSAQSQAQAEFTPSRQKLYNQKKRILALIEQDGFITNWGAIHDVKLHCSKLSTRIGEIERTAGLAFVRERCYGVDGQGKRYFRGMKYSLPEGTTINDFRK